MEVERRQDGGTDAEKQAASESAAAEGASGKAGRPPPIILTTAANLIQLQKQIKTVAKQSFEFRTTCNGTQVTTRDMVDYLAVKAHFDSTSMSYFTFFPKSLKPIKAVIRHLPHNTPAEDISNGLVDLGFDVISVKQMSSPRRTPDEGAKILPLFLITLPRTAKLQEIFKLPPLCHIAIKAEACKTQNSLTQCYNCQKFGHVWANCKQPPCCLWCGGGHLHKDCPEKRNASSQPACCNCELVEGKSVHPANYRGCSHAREVLRVKKSQATLKTAARVFTSNFATPALSFAAALRGEKSTTPPIQQAAERPAKSQPTTPRPQQETGQSVQAPNVSGLPLDNMVRVVSAVQQIITELSGAVSEESKILAITRIVFNLMKENGK
jgi:hypothetical protein